MFGQRVEVEAVDDETCCLLHVSVYNSGLILLTFPRSGSKFFGSLETHVEYASTG